MLCSFLCLCLHILGESRFWSLRLIKISVLISCPNMAGIQGSKDFLGRLPWDLLHSICFRWQLQASLFNIWNCADTWYKSVFSENRLLLVFMSLYFPRQWSTDGRPTVFSSRQGRFRRWTAPFSTPARPGAGKRGSSMDEWTITHPCVMQILQGWHICASHAGIQNVLGKVMLCEFPLQKGTSTICPHRADLVKNVKAAVRGVILSIWWAWYRSLGVNWLGRLCFIKMQVSWGFVGHYGHWRCSNATGMKNYVQPQDIMELGIDSCELICGQITRAEKCRRSAVLLWCLTSEKHVTQEASTLLNGRRWGHSRS